MVRHESGCGIYLTVDHLVSHNRLKLALLTAFLSDAAGGFSRSIPGIARALDRLPGVEVHVVGVRDDRSPDAWRHWGANVQAHCQIGIRAFGWAPGVAKALQRLRPDLVDAQGLWMYPSLASLTHHRRFGRPYMITPRGMLDPWALGRSSWKKRLVALWFEDDHLRRAACLRALNTDEAAAFRTHGLKNPIAIVPNGVELPVDAAPPRQASRTILFLGRIDPKKGVAELLRAWALLGSRAADWRLQVTGWGAPAYVASMRKLANELGIEGSTAFTGPLFGEDKTAAFRDAAAFVLPSYSEGLPMAILEAWSFRLPVLMTRACNLPLGFVTGAAREITTQPEDIARALRALMRMPEDERFAIGRAGRRLVEERFTWGRAAGEMHGVYTWALGGGPRPSCVITD